MSLVRPSRTVAHVPTAVDPAVWVPPTTITSGATVAARITTLAAIVASCAVVAAVWVMLAPVRRMESAARQAEAAATVATLRRLDERLHRRRP